MLFRAGSWLALGYLQVLSFPGRSKAHLFLYKLKLSIQSRPAQTMLERNAVFNSRVEPDNFFYHRNERLVNYDRKNI